MKLQGYHLALHPRTRCSKTQTSPQLLLPKAKYTDLPVDFLDVGVSFAAFFWNLD